MSTVWLGSIVEGEGELAAVPVLLRRLAARILPDSYVEVGSPVRISRNRVLAAGELSVAMERAARTIQRPGGIVILLDADEDCPARFGPHLVELALTARPDIPMGVVLANREFEAWFLAAAESLGGQRGLPKEIEPPTDPEAIRDAKGWLRKQMPRHRKYTETADQPALAASFDLDLARTRSPSFDKCCREIERLLRSLSPAPG